MEQAPKTREGRAVLAALNRPGIWKAGYGSITGIDLGEAFRSLPPGCDRDLARRLFIKAEAKFVPAFMASIERQEPDGHQ